MAAFLEGLTATHDASFFHDEATRLGNPLREGIRGSPLNKGPELQAVHPVIRTNRKSKDPLQTLQMHLDKSFSCDWMEISVCE
jgi:hypothetical protein